MRRKRISFTGVIPGRCESIEPGISRFRVWSFGPSRNDSYAFTNDRDGALCSAQASTLSLARG